MIVFFDHHVGRFIPAGAGNGVLIERCKQSIAVHPRGCGERDALQDELALETGSSPRVRGTEPYI